MKNRVADPRLGWYHNFDKERGEPDNARGREHYLAVCTPVTKMWADQNADKRFKYLVEYPARKPDAPILSRAEPMDGGLIVYYGAPIFDGGSPITHCYVAIYPIKLYVSFSSPSSRQAPQTPLCLCLQSSRKHLFPAQFVARPLPPSFSLHTSSVCPTKNQM